MWHELGQILKEIQTEVKGLWRPAPGPAPAVPQPIRKR